MAVALIHGGTTGTCPVYQRLGISTAEAGDDLRRLKELLEDR